MSDYVETVYELPLLLNNTASEKFFTQIGSCAKCWLDVMTGVRIWRWLSEYVALEKKFYSLLSEQEVRSTVQKFPAWPTF